MKESGIRLGALFCKDTYLCRVMIMSHVIIMYHRNIKLHNYTNVGASHDIYRMIIVDNCLLSGNFYDYKIDNKVYIR